MQKTVLVSNCRTLCFIAMECYDMYQGGKGGIFDVGSVQKYGLNQSINGFKEGSKVWKFC